MKVIIIGPAHPLRGGGITTFNERLARAFMQEAHEVKIYSFSLQYPGFLFPGKSQFTDEPAPQDLNIITCINSVNPLNWLQVGNRIRYENADLVIVRYWLPFMGPALGTILRRVSKNKVSRIVCIADNIVPHEKRVGDKMFTRYFVKPVHAFITMSEKVLADLRFFAPQKPALLTPHPLYDNFGDKLEQTAARKELGIGAEEKILLFFGFIRKYKGLDILLEAFAKVHDKIPDLKLLIAGEFYDDQKFYESLIDKLGIRERLYLHTDFIPDSRVKYYLCAADCVVQPYRNATQSGVTPLAYHFEIPMIVTRVGGLPDMVPDGKAGLIANPDANDLAEKIQLFFEKGSAGFLPGLREEKQKYSWDKMVQSILQIAQITHNSPAHEI